jgi:hypothetical protein
LASAIDLTLEFFKNDTISLKDWYYTVENFNTFIPYKGVGNYTLKIFDNNNSLLMSERFNVLFYLQIYTENGIETRTLNSTTVNMRINLPPKSYNIAFFKNDIKIASFNLGDLICNRNSICEKEKGENEYLCPSECLTLTQRSICGNKICETGETQENCCKDCGCPSGYNCIENKCVKTTSSLIYLIFALIFAILVAIVILKSKKFHPIS